MGKKSKWRRIALGLALVATLLVAYGLWPVSVVELRTDGDRRNIRRVMRIAPEETLAVGFVHSLYRVEQEERYALRDGRLWLVSVYFGSFDALNYYDPMGQLPARPLQGGYEVVLDPPKSFPVNFSIAHSTKIWLRVGDEIFISLDKLEPQASRFSLSVIHTPRVLAQLSEHWNEHK